MKKIELTDYYKRLADKSQMIGLKCETMNDEIVYIKDVESGIFAGKNCYDEYGHNYSMRDLKVIQGD